MKTRILCFLMLLIATSSLCTVNAQSYYWEENTTPFTMHYILDISSNYNGIPPEIKCLGGSFGTIGTAKFYKDKVILNDFYNLLFTAKSNNYYKMSYALLVAYDPYEIYEYAKKQKLVG